MGSLSRFSPYAAFPAVYGRFLLSTEIGGIIGGYRSSWGFVMAGGIVRRGALNKLTPKAVEAFVRRRDPGSKLPDGGGLHCFITPSGTAAWRVNFRFAKKYRTYAAGVYPTVSLAQAREKRAKVKEQLSMGIDPVAAKQEEKLANIARATDARAEKTFEEFVREWMARRSVKQGWSEIHARQVEQAFNRYTFKRVGFANVPISKVTQDAVIDAVTAIIDKRRYESASKLLQNLNLIFKSAKLRKHRTDNPAEGLADELIPGGRMRGQRPAITEIGALGDILRRTELAPIAPVVRLCLKLTAYTAQRLGNVLEAKWSEFDLDSEIPVWTIRRDRMKVKRRPLDHRVILGENIANELRTWRKVTGGKGYLFPAPGGAAHLRHETPEKVYRKTLGLNGQHVAHGWRSSLASIAKDSGLFSKDAVDMTLDHVHDNQVSMAYDRGERWEERVRLARWWDSQLTNATNETKPPKLNAGRNDHNSETGSTP